jgi:hypothetical protein
MKRLAVLVLISLVTICVRDAIGDELAAKIIGVIAQLNARTSALTARRQVLEQQAANLGNEEKATGEAKAKLEFELSERQLRTWKLLQETPNREVGQKFAKTMTGEQWDLFEAWGTATQKWVQDEKAYNAALEQYNQDLEKLKNDWDQLQVIGQVLSAEQQQEAAKARQNAEYLGLLTQFNALLQQQQQPQVAPPSPPRRTVCRQNPFALTPTVTCKEE